MMWVQTLWPEGVSKSKTDQSTGVSSSMQDLMNGYLAEKLHSDRLHLLRATHASLSLCRVLIIWDLLCDYSSVFCQCCLHQDVLH